MIQAGEETIAYPVVRTDEVIGSDSTTAFIGEARYKIGAIRKFADGDIVSGVTLYACNFVEFFYKNLLYQHVYGISKFSNRGSLGFDWGKRYSNIKGLSFFGIAKTGFKRR